MRKIKITANQLIRLKESLEMETSDLNELGSEEWSMNKQGHFQRGMSEEPDPYEMADIVIRDIKLHPAYYEDRNKMYAFLDAITEKLIDEVESGGLPMRDYDQEMLDVDNAQLNENNIESKTMKQLKKTYPAPPPMQKPKKKFDITETPEFMAEKVQFKSLFKNKNIEPFRKELYKYIHSNKKNPKLVDKLLKMLYKP